MLKYLRKFNLIQRANYHNTSRPELIRLTRFKFCVLNKGQEDKLHPIHQSESGEEDESLDFDSLFPEKESTTGDLNKIAGAIKCRGCGVDLQIENENKIGFIPEKKLKEFINNEKDSPSHNDDNLSQVRLKEFELIHDAEIIRKIKNLKPNVLTCERCYKLKHYNSFDMLGSKKNKRELSHEEKVENYTRLIKRISPDLLIKQIVTRISKQAHVFYICDITELELTVNLNLLKELKQKGCGVTFIVNKFDILPLKVVEERIRVWVGEILKDITSSLPELDYSYIVVSSKNGHNMDHVLHRIKTLKEKARANKIPRLKLFVVGNTNVGKSTFINKLVQRSHRYRQQEDKEYYQKNYDIPEDSNDLNLPHDVSNLTTSPLPGTTIGITKVESAKLGLKLFDTPGIPVKNSMNYLMDKYVDMISVNIDKKIIPYSLNLKQGYCVWIGALARVEFMNGDDKYFTFFFSHNVTIHRTPLLNSENVFTKHAGKLLRPVITTNINEIKFVKTTFNLHCQVFRMLNYDVVIPGLGWFSVSGKGFMQIDVYTPEGVVPILREKPLMPYEIQARGVKKYYGKTLNSNSKINRRFQGDLNA